VVKRVVRRSGLERGRTRSFSFFLTNIFHWVVKKHIIIFISRTKSFSTIIVDDDDDDGRK
jgi:hypothetical protein